MWSQCTICTILWWREFALADVSFQMLSGWGGHPSQEVASGALMSLSDWCSSLFFSRSTKRSHWASRTLGCGCGTTPAVDLTTCTGSIVIWPLQLPSLRAVSFQSALFCDKKEGGVTMLWEACYKGQFMKDIHWCVTDRSMSWLSATLDRFWSVFSRQTWRLECEK